MSKKFSKKGQILSEAIIAMGLLTIGIFGISNFFVISLREGRTVREQTTAVQLANEGVEITRNIISANGISISAPWSSGFPSSGSKSYELDINSSSLSGADYKGKTLKYVTEGGKNIYKYNTSGGTSVDTTFKREIVIERETNYGFKVTSVVTWAARAGRVNKVVVSSYLLNWQ